MSNIRKYDKDKRHPMTSVHSRSKVEEPILDTLRFRTTKESELEMNFF
jgi:hypothetical protein